MSHRRRQARRVLLIAAALVALSPAPRAAAQQRVGEVAFANGTVEGTPPGGPKAPLGDGDPIVLQHLVETGHGSEAQMTLDPHGVLSMGQDSHLRVDQATLDRATGRSQSSLTLLLGKIELALGSLFRGEVTVDTPTASLGIKGTVLRVLVDPSGRTLVAVLEGVVEVTAKAGGTVRVPAGSYTIVGPDGPPLAPAPFDPSAGTLSPAAGGPDFSVPGEDVFTETPLLPERDLDLPREPPATQGKGLTDQGPPPGR